MDAKLYVAFVGGFAALLAPAISYYLTKRQERSVARHNLKLDQYRQFIDALAGIVDGEATDENQRRFSRSSNNMFLIASHDVIRAMQMFRDEIRISNPNKTDEKHDRLLSRLVWEIRKDLGDTPTDDPQDFQVRLWASGVRRIQ